MNTIWFLVSKYIHIGDWKSFIYTCRMTYKYNSDEEVDKRSNHLWSLILYNKKFKHSSSYDDNIGLIAGNKNTKMEYLIKWCDNKKLDLAKNKFCHNPRASITYIKNTNSNFKYIYESEKYKWKHIVRDIIEHQKEKKVTIYDDDLDNIVEYLKHHKGRELFSNPACSVNIPLEAFIYILYNINLDFDIIVEQLKNPKLSWYDINDVISDIPEYLKVINHEYGLQSYDFASGYLSESTPIDYILENPDYHWNLIGLYKNNQITLDILRNILTGDIHLPNISLCDYEEGGIHIIDNNYNNDVLIDLCSKSCITWEMIMDIQLSGKHIIKKEECPKYMAGHFPRSGYIDILCWEGVVKNPNTTLNKLEIILKNKYINYKKYNDISSNPNLTWRFIRDHPDIYWCADQIYSNSFNA